MAALTNTLLEFNQFADFSTGWVWEVEDAAGVRTPKDLTDYAALMQVRRSKDSPDPQFEVTTVEDDGTVIVLDDQGNVDLFVSDTITSDISWKKAVYDLVLIAPDGRKTRFAEGDATCDFGVSR